MHSLVRTERSSCGVLFNNLFLCVWSFFLYAFVAKISRISVAFYHVPLLIHNITISSSCLNAGIQPTLNNNKIYLHSRCNHDSSSLPPSETKAHYSLCMAWAVKVCSHNEKADTNGKVMSLRVCSFNNLFTPFAGPMTSTPKYFIWFYHRGSLGNKS